VRKISSLILAGFCLLAVLPLNGQDQPVFRSESHFVEVYTTVHDKKGRAISGLAQSDFHLQDNGVPQEIANFEAQEGSLSCAILLDVTGSMADALPAVKANVGRFIEQFRPGDAVAVYSFNEKLRQLQDFTLDHAAARQAVLRTKAGGSTALFDAISLLARALGERRGKKAIVVFTDGDDNASVLNAASAIQRAKKDGYPLYIIAEGDALKSRPLLRTLEEMSDSTGGRLHTMKSLKDIGRLFEDITAELQHTYLMTYRAPSNMPGWHSIQVSVAGPEAHQIRSRLGYMSAQ
jgi:Ca-activated chloride channel family protein